eukprot:Tamp_09332.p3 GENE.Tamp_09332~~Tamp_09332.p3  ORF type:complete len:161 (-),score=1.03 Tamp_09332:291-773(-)
MRHGSASPLAAAPESGPLRLLVRSALGPSQEGLFRPRPIYMLAREDALDLRPAPKSHRLFPSCSNVYPCAVCACGAAQQMNRCSAPRHRQREPPPRPEACAGAPAEGTESSAPATVVVGPLRELRAIMHDRIVPMCLDRLRDGIGRPRTPRAAARRASLL